MHKIFFKAALGLLISSLLFACQKDFKETSFKTLAKQNGKFSQPGQPTQFLNGLGITFGSATGPGGDLFVSDASSGVIFRIDSKTGAKSTFASGLPQMIPEVGFGGITDLAFIGGTAYAIVTLVDDPNLFPTGQVNGVYRIDGPNNYTIIADIGAFNLANPPTGFAFDVATGVSFSIQNYQGDFLVTDGHLNRVLRITLNGEITIERKFNNIVPTGLAVRGNKVYLAQAGPVPHTPETGKVVSFSKTSSITNIASGASLLVDVESGQGQTLFALSQGNFNGGDPEGSPALPNTGSLVRVNADGTFSVIADQLDRPTSLEIIGNKAYIITLTGEIWTIENIANPPFGGPQ